MGSNPWQEMRAETIVACGTLSVCIILSDPAQIHNWSTCCYGWYIPSYDEGFDLSIGYCGTGLLALSREVHPTEPEACASP